MKFKNLIGQKFDRLEVVSLNGKSKTKHTTWNCKCLCGSSSIVNTSSLTRGLTKSCGCLLKEKASKRAKLFVNDLSGKKFGHLSVLYRDYVIQSDKKSSSAYWQCRCDCGNTVSVCGSNLTRNNGTRSCGCLSRKLFIERNNKRKLPNDESSINEIFGRYKKQARHRKIQFLLNKDDFKKMISDICYYCGDKGKNQCNNFFYNGIDRVDSDKGYLLDNCVTCCHTCNRSKSDFSIDAFKKWIVSVYNKICL